MQKGKGHKASQSHSNGQLVNGDMCHAKVKSHSYHNDQQGSNATYSENISSKVKEHQSNPDPEPWVVLLEPSDPAHLNHGWQTVPQSEQPTVHELDPDLEPWVLTLEAPVVEQDDITASMWLDSEEELPQADTELYSPKSTVNQESDHLQRGRYLQFIHLMDPKYITHMNNVKLTALYAWQSDLAHITIHSLHLFSFQIGFVI